MVLALPAALSEQAAAFVPSPGLWGIPDPLSTEGSGFSATGEYCMVLRLPLTSRNVADLLFPLRVLSWRAEPWSSPRWLHTGYASTSPPPQDISQQCTGIAVSDQYFKSSRRDWMSFPPRVLQQLIRWLCAVIMELLCDTSVICQPVTCCHSQPLKLNQKNLWDSARCLAPGTEIWERGWDFWRKERKLSFKITLRRKPRTI